MNDRPLAEYVNDYRLASYSQTTTFMNPYVSNKTPTYGGLQVAQELMNTIDSSLVHACTLVKMCTEQIAYGQADATEYYIYDILYDATNASPIDDNIPEVVHIGMFKMPISCMVVKNDNGFTFLCKDCLFVQDSIEDVNKMRGYLKSNLKKRLQRE